MAYIEPNTEIRFLHDVPLDPDYENTLYFDNKEQQTNYFLNRTKHTFTNQSYQRKNKGWLRVGFLTDVYGGSVIRDLYNSTYMMFKNSNYENKWFYAFVDKVEYVNNNTVDVQYHIDVMQTWHFDYVLNQCFIERQHATTDYVGSNTIPEQLETGDYMDAAFTYTENDSTWLGPHYRYTPGILLAIAFANDGSYYPGKMVSGWGSRGDYFTGVNTLVYGTAQADITAINTTLESITDAAKSDGVLGLCMCPKSLLNADGTSKDPSHITFSVGGAVGPLNGYVPRNKKLLTYPYQLFYVTNNMGNSAEYHFEFFSDPLNPSFDIWANFSTNPGMICEPRNYKGMSFADDEKITVDGFPMCAWTFDTFRAWLAQNQGAMVSGVVNAGIQTAFAIANPAKALSQAENLLTQVSSAIGQVYDHYRMPPQAKGTSNGNLVYQASLLTFTFYKKHIRPEYARIIDEYFDMYGYATHRVGVPNRNARRCYTYVKTVGCSIHGDLPSDDIIDIQNLFNRGIRFWRSTAVFGNYDPSVNNNQV